jgi:hypothetical protein
MSWQAKGMVFEKSYDEVLAALKHQDDKLNRTLTAIAFLTAAGVAIFANIATKVPAPRFGHEPPIAVSTFFFVTFLGAVVFALVFALAAIGPSDALPRLRKSSAPASEEWPSLLFYARMLRDPDWSKHIDRDSDWLQQCIARSYHAEALTLAQRVDYKVARSRESGACVQLAVLSLSLLGIFSVTELSLSTRWWIASSLLIAMLALPLWDGYLMYRFDFKDRKAMKQRTGAYVAAFVIGATGTAGLAMAPAWHSHWWALAYALAAILSTRLAVSYERSRLLRRLFLIGPAVVGPVVLLLAWLS